MKSISGLLIFILTISYTNSYSQFDKDIFKVVSQSMNFKKWEEINTLSLVYDNRQKNTGDKTPFSQITLISNESLVVDKNKGFKSERKNQAFTIVLKENKKYTLLLSNLDNYKPDITYHKNDDVVLEKDFNFIKNNPEIQVLMPINIFTMYRDSLIYTRNVDIYGEECRMYFTPSIENPIFKFFIDKNNYIKGLIHGSDFRTQHFYIDYEDIEGIVIPKTVLFFDNKYQNEYTLLDLKTNIYIPQGIFYE